MVVKSKGKKCAGLMLASVRCCWRAVPSGLVRGTLGEAAGNNGNVARYEINWHVQIYFRNEI